MTLTNKFIASFTAIAVVASQFAFVSNLSVKANNAENMLAYEWAFDAGLTTMTSYSAFMPMSAVTREAAARFLVKGADALGATPTSDQSCGYTDLANADQTLTEFVNEGCEMGIFIAQDLFNPKSIMTRSQAELTISRIIYGMEEVGSYASDNGITEFAAARELLMADEVVQVEIPGESAVQRLHLILMLYRLADMDMVDPVDPTDPTDPVEVRQGALDVSLNSATLANNSQIPSTGVIRFAAVNMSAGSNDITVRSVEVAKMGLATIPSSTRVWFEKNGVRVTGKAAFTSEGKAVLSFAPVLTVKAGSTETLDLFVELSTTPGFDFQFTSAMIDASAQTVNGSFTTPVLRTVNYQVITSAFAVASIGGTSSVTANGMELGAFQTTINNISSETRNASFKSITLRQDGNASLNSLSNIVLERNGAVVSSNPTINGRDLTFSINDTILDSTTATYYIKAVVNNVEQATDTYKFTVRNSSDINIVEANTAFRTIVTPGTNLALNAYNIQGGDITFARDTAVALSKDVAPGTTNVVLMQGTMKSNAAITVEDPSVDYLNSLTDSGAAARFSTVYLQIGSSTFSYSPTVNGSATGAKFLGTATVNGTVAVKMRATLKQTAPSGSVKFGPLQLSSFARKEYVSNGNNVNTAVGSIEGINITVQNSTLNITRTDGKGDSVVAAGTSDFTVIKLAATSNQGNGVRLSRVEFTVTPAPVATPGAMNNVSLSLLVNGTVVQTKSVTTGTVFFDNFNTNVTAASGATLEVKANFAEAFSNGSFRLTLSALNAVDLLTSAAVTYNMPAGAVFTIGSANALVTAASNQVLSRLLLSPKNDNDLMKFNVKALNDSVQLRDVTFTGTNLDKMTNFRILDAANNTIVAIATTTTSGAVTFVNIPSAPSIAKDATANYTLVANVNSNSTGAVSLTLTSAAVKASNGNTIAISPLSIVSANHMITENTIVVAKGTNPNKEIGSSALVFTVFANSKDAVVLTGIAARISSAGYAGDSVIVYKTSISPGNIAFASSSYVNGTNAVWSTYNTGNATIDAGTTATYIVVLDNARGDGTNATQSWTARLSDIFFNGITGSTYTNVGPLPITEVK